MFQRFNALIFILLVFIFFSCSEENIKIPTDDNIISLPKDIKKIEYRDRERKFDYEFNSENNLLNTLIITSINPNHEDKIISKRVISFYYNNTNQLIKVVYELIKIEEHINEIQEFEIEYIIKSSNGFMTQTELIYSNYNESTAKYEVGFTKREFEYEDQKLTKITIYWDGKEFLSEIKNFDNFDLSLISKEKLEYDASGNIMMSEQQSYGHIGVTNNQSKPQPIASPQSNFTLNDRDTSDWRSIRTDHLEYDDKKNPLSGLNYSARVFLYSLGFVEGFFLKTPLLTLNNMKKLNTEYEYSIPWREGFKFERIFETNYDEDNLPIDVSINSTFSTPLTTSYTRSLKYEYKDQ
ncbi:hypothetical protein [Marivirga sp.]|uniref:hypothetical protein n=1 Tax=Marivirga sp. TaxID=2018662 RepID=UPI0025F1207B|nr:hypothetical protein [Marivirga sp.]